VEEVYWVCANQVGEDIPGYGRMVCWRDSGSVWRACLQPAVRLGLNAGQPGSTAIKVGEGDGVPSPGSRVNEPCTYSLPKAESGYPFGNLTAYDNDHRLALPNRR